MYYPGISQETAETAWLLPPDVDKSAHRVPAHQCTIKERLSVSCVLSCITREISQACKRKRQQCNHPDTHKLTGKRCSLPHTPWVQPLQRGELGECLISQMGPESPHNIANLEKTVSEKQSPLPQRSSRQSPSATRSERREEQVEPQIRVFLDLASAEMERSRRCERQTTVTHG